MFHSAHKILSPIAACPGQCVKCAQIFTEPAPQPRRKGSLQVLLSVLCPVRKLIAVECLATDLARELVALARWLLSMDMSVHIGDTAVP
ncbi:hypothetical protein M406DRAFT_322114 [Cryphonectria parasitica EP155]|uniref:Uncharacterized protein n=1 Tax=Cryphonectria parasitica (strain ATCC 38755 / EP155) TaxID=660469 RepID=A0A9P4Y382_CRYP1|nr:uncharacterized protein M406DRAFT_322114 [Cryphonectria parasitica EP155]KAF3765853.1 hypothetical protein M406DRAFT_322114 [Cryphonectria parasitica EP155]